MQRNILWPHVPKWHWNYRTQRPPYENCFSSGQWNVIWETTLFAEASDTQMEVNRIVYTSQSSHSSDCLCQLGCVWDPAGHLTLMLVEHCLLTWLKLSPTCLTSELSVLVFLTFLLMSKDISEMEITQLLKISTFNWLALNILYGI